MRLALDSLRFDENGLLPVIAQERTTGEVLMLAWANREALEATLRTGRVHYFSRSRARLWPKGETSGAVQDARVLTGDCDGDTVLALVDSQGAACHTGRDTCFVDGTPVRPTLAGLDATIQARIASADPASYTVRLTRDPNLSSKKVGEEAVEFVRALAVEDAGRVAEEAADLLYHVLVAAAGRGVGLKQVLAVLAARGS